MRGSPKKWHTPCACSNSSDEPIFPSCPEPSIRSDPVSADGSVRHHRGNGRCVAHRRSGTHPAHARTHRTNRYSRRARSRVSDLIQSPRTEVLGITVVTGDAWLTEEVAHTLRMLELIGRTDIPVVPGAEYPLVRTQEETEESERRYGFVDWLGAWTPKYYHAPRELGPMPEGKPTTKAAGEDAAHFLIRMVHKYPHEFTIYEGGPMTKLALAISIDQQND